MRSKNMSPNYRKVAMLSMWCHHWQSIVLKLEVITKWHINQTTHFLKENWRGKNNNNNKTPDYCTTTGFIFTGISRVWIVFSPPGEYPNSCLPHSFQEDSAWAGEAPVYPKRERNFVQLRVSVLCHFMMYWGVRVVSFLRKNLRSCYTISFVRCTDIQHSNVKRRRSNFFIPRSNHFLSAHT